MRKNAAVGLTNDVVATADGAVWFELRNNLDGFFPCLFDKLVLA